jgi:hypothetical protein
MVRYNDQYLREQYSQQVVSWAAMVVGCVLCCFLVVTTYHLVVPYAVVAKSAVIAEYHHDPSVHNHAGGGVVSNQRFPDDG